MEKLGHHRDFGIRDLGLISLSKLTTLDLHNNRCPCHCPFALNFPIVPPPKIGPPWKKKIIFEILAGRAINHVILFNFKNLKIQAFLAQFCDQAQNRTIAANNRTMEVYKFQLFGYIIYIISYNCAKIRCSSFLGF